MTSGDAETAAVAFVELVQRHGGTAGALAALNEQIGARTLEAAARFFDGQTGSWTAREVAQAIRGMRP